jgi:hypothetical protein
MESYWNLKQNAKSYIGSGAWRDVYDLGDGYVIKFAKSERGIRCNRREVRLYRSLPTRLKKYLGRIKGHGKGYGWIIMRYHWREFPKRLRYRRRLSRIRMLFRRYGIHPYETVAKINGEPNYQNLRVKRTGRIVVIDYGNFIRRQARRGDDSSRYNQ